MIRDLRVTWRATIMNVMNTLEYRGAFFIYMINTVAAPTIYLLIWLAVDAQGVSLPYDRTQFVTYYVLLSLVSMLTSTWLAYYLAQDIRLGGLSPWLLRPTTMTIHYVSNNIGEKIIKLPLLLPLIGLVALAFGRDLSLPTDPVAWLLFCLSVPLAAAIAFLIDVVIGSLAFWIEDVGGLIDIKELTSSFLAGRFVPLALFPEALQPLIKVQPFRYTLSFPLEVLTGGLSSHETLYGLACQIGYCLALWSCYRFMWRIGLRSYTSPGG